MFRTDARRLSLTERLIILLLTVFLAQPSKAASSPLEITLDLNEERYLLHEPLTARITFINRSGKQIRIPSHYLEEPGAEILTFLIQDENEMIIGFNPIGIPDFAYSPKFRGEELKPNARYVVWVDLSMQRSKPETWNKPGEYLLQGRYRWVKKESPLITDLTAVSPKVKVRVDRPQGIDRKALDLLLQAIHPVLGVWNYSPMQVTNYRTLLKQYPQSRYARYAHVHLAIALESQARENPSLRDNALQEWRTIATKYPRFGYTDFAKERIAYNLFEAGRTTDALKAYQKLMNDPQFPDRRKLEASLWIQKIRHGR